MIRMIADASLPDLSPWFHHAFHITRFDTERELHQQLLGQDILLCRSTLKVNSDLLGDTQIRCVATLSSGTDHIDERAVSQSHVHVIDAKGANARAVADYVVASVAYVQQQGLLTGKRVGIIGMGAVGTAVSERLQALGFQIYGYDPLRSLREPTFSSCDLQALWSCQLLCVHANLHDHAPYPSRHILDAHFLSQLTSGVVIINAARGDVVDERAVLACTQSLHYCTDVYVGEPYICPEIIQRSTLCTPHIAGHSIEAKRRALAVVSEKLHQWCDVPIPAFPQIERPSSLSELDMRTWQAAILAIYNPEYETRTLKHSQNLPETFLTLRAAHCVRHEF